MPKTLRQGRFNGEGKIHLIDRTTNGRYEQVLCEAPATIEAPANIENIWVNTREYCPDCLRYFTKCIV